MNTNLADAVLDALPARAADQVTWGKVAAVNPLTVTVTGDTDPTRITLRAGSCNPAAGDTVALLKVGSRWVALCTLVAG